MRRASLFLVLFVGTICALLLTSCGGGGSTSTTSTPVSSTTSATSAPARSEASKVSGNHGGSVRRQTWAEGSPPPPRPPHPSPREVRKAGKAAGFLAPQGDNSVPTYGSEASGEQRNVAESELAGFLEARADENWSAACSYLSGASRKRFEEFAGGPGSKPKGCAPILKMFSSSEPNSSLTSPLTHALTSLRVKGENAFALWVGPHGQKYAMPMVREGHVWRVNQIAPLPYPPGGAP